MAEGTVEHNVFDWASQFSEMACDHAEVRHEEVWYTAYHGTLIERCVLCGNEERVCTLGRY